MDISYEATMVLQSKGPGSKILLLPGRPDPTTLNLPHSLRSQVRPSSMCISFSTEKNSSLVFLTFLSSSMTISFLETSGALMKPRRHCNINARQMEKKINKHGHKTKANSSATHFVRGEEMIQLLLINKGFAMCRAFSGGEGVLIDAASVLSERQLMEKVNCVGCKATCHTHASFPY